MTTTLPKPTGSAAAFQIHISDVTNINSKCAWYVKAKLGYNKKQKSLAQKAADHKITFDEIFYFERWEPKETVEVSVWKEKKPFGHHEVATFLLESPGKHEECKYERITELFPSKPKSGGDVKAPEGRARANTHGAVPDANKPCGEMTLTVTHVPGRKRWQQIQDAKGGGAAADGESKKEEAAKIDASSSEQVGQDGPSQAPNAMKAQMAMAATASEPAKEEKKESDAAAEPAKTEAAEPAKAEEQGEAEPAKAEAEAEAPKAEVEESA